MCCHFHGVCVSIPHRSSDIRHIFAVLFMGISAPSFLDLRVQIAYWQPKLYLGWALRKTPGAISWASFKRALKLALICATIVALLRFLKRLPLFLDFPLRRERGRCKLPVTYRAGPGWDRDRRTSRAEIS